MLNVQWHIILFHVKILVIFHSTGQRGECPHQVNKYTNAMNNLISGNACDDHLKSYQGTKTASCGDLGPCDGLDSDK